MHMNNIAHRFNTLDGMRGVAAIAVLAHHLTQHTSRSIFSGAGLAVDLFFCLSGFVIAHSYLDRLRQSMSIGDFVLRRLVRLYPMFFCGLIIGSIALIAKVALSQSSLGYREASIAILANALYLPYLSDFYVTVGKHNIPSAIFPTNDPSWSLFFEFIANLLLAAVVIRAQKVAYLITLCLIGMFGLCIWLKVTWMGEPGWGAGNIVGGLPRVTFGFFSGILAYLFYQRYGQLIPVVKPVFLVTLLVALFFKGWGSPIWLVETLFAVPVLVLLGAVSMPVSSNEERRSEYLGWISYPVYCLHLPVYSIFTLATGNTDYGLIGLLICAPITIVLSHLLTKKIEEPVRRIVSARLFS